MVGQCWKNETDGELCDTPQHCRPAGWLAPCQHDERTSHDALMVTAAVEHEALAKNNIAKHNANGLLTVPRPPWISPSVTYDSASCRRGAASVQEGWMHHLP